MNELNLHMRVQNQIIEYFERNNVVADSEGYLRLNFEFSEDWSGIPKFIQFYKTLSDEKPVEMPLVGASGGSFYCIVPSEIIKPPNFYIGVYGTNSVNRRITTSVTAIAVRRSGFSPTSVLPEIPPVPPGAIPMNTVTAAGEKIGFMRKNPFGDLETSDDTGTWTKAKTGANVIRLPQRSATASQIFPLFHMPASGLSLDFDIALTRGVSSYTGKYLFRARAFTKFTVSSTAPTAALDNTVTVYDAAYEDQKIGCRMASGVVYFYLMGTNLHPTGNIIFNLASRTADNKDVFHEIVSDVDLPAVTDADEIAAIRTITRKDTVYKDDITAPKIMTAGKNILREITNRLIRRDGLALSAQTSYGVKYSPYGDYAFFLSYNGHQSLLGVRGRVLKKLSYVNLGTSRSPAFAPDNRYAAFSFFNSNVPYIYPINAGGTLGERITTVTVPDGTPAGSFYGLEFSPDGNFLAALSYGITSSANSTPIVRLWSVNKNTNVFTFINNVPQYQTAEIHTTYALKWAYDGTNLYLFAGYNIAPYVSVYRVTPAGTVTLLNVTFAGISAYTSAFEVINNENGVSKYLLAGTNTAGNYLQVYDISQIASGTVSKLPNLDAASLLPGVPVSMELTSDKTELFTYHAGSPYISIFNVNANTGALTLQSPRFENSSSAAIPSPSTVTHKISVSNDKKLVSISGQGAAIHGGIRTFAIAQNISEVIEQAEEDTLPQAPLTGTQALQSVNGVVRWV